jgi:tetratricopeptide (TPR) repeat protein
MALSASFGGFLLAPRLVLALLYFAAMSTTEKKTEAAVVPESGLDTEGLLLQRLNNTTNEDEYFRWMLFVVGFYRGINKSSEAIDLLEGFIKSDRNNENKAHCHLALGQIATDEKRFAGALEHFNSALALRPEKRKVKYVLHNNIGYCLNHLKRHVEAEKYCRAAIDIDWTRASAFRNLGISLTGQGNLIGAAWVLMEAITAEPGDLRARQLVDQLVKSNPGLTLQCPWLSGSVYTENSAVVELPLM